MSSSRLGILAYRDVFEKCSHDPKVHLHGNSAPCSWELFKEFIQIAFFNMSLLHSQAYDLCKKTVDEGKWDELTYDEIITLLSYITEKDYNELLSKHYKKNRSRITKIWDLVQCIYGPPLSQSSSQALAFSSIVAHPSSSSSSSGSAPFVASQSSFSSGPSVLPFVPQSQSSSNASSRSLSSYSSHSVSAPQGLGSLFRALATLSAGLQQQLRTQQPSSSSSSSSSVSSHSSLSLPPNGWGYSPLVRVQQPSSSSSSSASSSVSSQFFSNSSRSSSYAGQQSSEGSSLSSVMMPAPGSSPDYPIEKEKTPWRKMKVEIKSVHPRELKSGVRNPEYAKELLCNGQTFVRVIDGKKLWDDEIKAFSNPRTNRKVNLFQYKDVKQIDRSIFWDAKQKLWLKRVIKNERGEDKDTNYLKKRSASKMPKHLQQNFIRNSAPVPAPFSYSHGVGFADDGVLVNDSKSFLYNAATFNRWWIKGAAPQLSQNDLLKRKIAEPEFIEDQLNHDESQFVWSEIMIKSHYKDGPLYLFQRNNEGADFLYSLYLHLEWARQCHLDLPIFILPGNGSQKLINKNQLIEKFLLLINKKNTDKIAPLEQKVNHDIYYSLLQASFASNEHVIPAFIHVRKNSNMPYWQLPSEILFIESIYEKKYRNICGVLEAEGYNKIGSKYPNFYLMFFDKLKREKNLTFFVKQDASELFLQFSKVVDKTIIIQTLLDECQHTNFKNGDDILSFILKNFQPLDRDQFNLLCHQPKIFQALLQNLDRDEVLTSLSQGSIESKQLASENEGAGLLSNFICSLNSHLVKEKNLEGLKQLCDKNILFMKFLLPQDKSILIQGCINESLQNGFKDIDINMTFILRYLQPLNDHLDLLCKDPAIFHSLLKNISFEVGRDFAATKADHKAMPNQEVSTPLLRNFIHSLISYLIQNNHLNYIKQLLNLKISLITRACKNWRDDQGNNLLHIFAHCDNPITINKSESYKKEYGEIITALYLATGDDLLKADNLLWKTPIEVARRENNINFLHAVRDIDKLDSVMLNNPVGLSELGLPALWAVPESKSPLPSPVQSPFPIFDPPFVPSSPDLPPKFSLSRQYSPLGIIPQTAAPLSRQYSPSGQVPLPPHPLSRQYSPSGYASLLSSLVSTPDPISSSSSSSSQVSSSASLVLKTPLSPQSLPARASVSGHFGHHGNKRTLDQNSGQGGHQSKVAKPMSPA